MAFYNHDRGAQLWSMEKPLELTSQNGTRLHNLHYPNCWATLSFNLTRCKRILVSLCRFDAVSTEEPLRISSDVGCTSSLIVKSEPIC